MDILKQRVYLSLENAGIPLDLVPDLQENFEEFVLPFDDIQSTYGREKFIKENYLYVVSMPNLLLYSLKKTNFIFIRNTTLIFLYAVNKGSNFV